MKKPNSYDVTLFIVYAFLFSIAVVAFWAMMQCEM